MPVNSFPIRYLTGKQQMLLLWLGLSLLFMLSCWSVARATLNHSLTQSLQQQLPTKLQNALYYSNDDGPIVQLIQHNINRDLVNLKVQNQLPVFNLCHGNVIELMAGVDDTAGFNQISIKWSLGKLKKQTFIAVSCQTNWPVAVIYPAGFAAALLFFYHLLPVPLSASGQRIRQSIQPHMSNLQAHYWARLLQQGNATQHLLFEHLLAAHGQDIPALSNWTMRPQVAALTSKQLDWFMLATDKFHYSKQQALDVALAPAQLSFSQTPGHIKVQGLSIKLMKTPYFYYLWYACLRHQGDGWQLNPSVNRADKTAADMLITLMRNAGGHSKALNDLLEHGLRAKILDQNRNKLKAELIALLGESLAEDYLFDTERDLKSGRYRYRLSLAAEAVTLPQQLLAQQ
ncbi:hypothetical protein [Neptunicella sp. SCSIO 80796]|uniref:hypothetical protein n=1 Tax=Neptunicella plasticusilytica TaxID=3117012 RepID=UPI003A4D4D6F